MTACCTVGLFAGVPSALGAPDGQRGMSAEHARVVEYWTPARRAAAIPRDLVIDERGQGYLRRPDGVLVPYGRQIADGAGAMAPNAKPGGGGGGSGDTTQPDISGMKPASGATIGASYTFEATVTDSQSSIRSVKFYVRKGSSRTQSFSAATSGNNVWTVGLSGFSDGAWSWYAVATDAAGNSRTSATLSFAVDTSGGGGTGGSGDTVTNTAWAADDAIGRAAGRIYFEMPSNAKRTRWAGYVCSGTVVTDSTNNDRSIILTAAHCVYDDANKAFARNVMFIPDQDATTGTGTDRNCANDPYGCWVPSFGVVDEDWTTRTFPDNVKWDYAYYVVKTSGARQAGFKANVSEVLETAVGALDVSFAPPSTDDGSAGKTTLDFTHALGYSYSDDPKFMYCAEDMTTQGTDNWWLPSCGLSGGSSGGPWTQGLNTSANDVVMSVNSWGYTNQPGMAGPKLSGTSASCVFGDAQNTAYGNVLTTDGDAGVKSGCAL